jgi:hypothetical protein
MENNPDPGSRMNIPDHISATLLASIGIAPKNFGEKLLYTSTLVFVKVELPQF